MMNRNRQIRGCVEDICSRVPASPPTPWFPPLSRSPAPGPRPAPGWRTPVLLHRSGEPHQSRYRGTLFQGRKEQRHILYGNDDIIANKRQQPYHSSVEHTAPHRRGGANQNDHRPHPTGGGGDKAKHDQTGKATRPNKTTTHS